MKEDWLIAVVVVIAIASAVALIALQISAWFYP